MREIIIDTETTGLEPLNGDRLVEIGCVELANRWPTGNTFHCYLNPERDMPQGAFQVHGLSEEFLADKPLFADVADSFLDFIGDAALVAHNASFDVGFLNAELARVGLPVIGRERVVDTLMLARRKHPGAPVSLDALCSRYGIDNSNRVKHGALLDAELLAEVYVELVEARQARLSLVVATGPQTHEPSARGVQARPMPLPSRLTVADITAHRAFVETLGAEPLWNLYLATDAPPEAPPQAEG